MDAWRQLEAALKGILTREGARIDLRCGLKQSLRGIVGRTGWDASSAASPRDPAARSTETCFQ
eukprot:3628158-Alexandrium_andersonii.AAC.1